MPRGGLLLAAPPQLVASRSPIRPDYPLSSPHPPPRVPVEPIGHREVGRGGFQFSKSGPTPYGRRQVPGGASARADGVVTPSVGNDSNTPAPEAGRAPGPLPPHPLALRPGSG